MTEKKIRFDADVPYLGEGRKEKLDLYRPAVDAAKPSPAVVIIHGGGWTGGTKSADREIQIAETLVAAGYVCVSIDYVLATPGHPTWPAAFDDCRQAVRFLRENAANYNINPARIGAIGGSAGGHLSLLLGSAEKLPEKVSGRVGAVVALYPPTDLTTLVPERSTLIGFSRAERPDLYRDASPTYQIDKDFPPVLLLHGTADETVPYSQSEELVTVLKRVGVRHELITVKDARHTFLIKNESHDFREKVVTFFDDALGK